MKYFNGITTIEELKKLYKKMAMLHHPDRGGTVEIMQEVNAEYDEVYNLIQTGKILKGEKIDISETSKESREILEKIINLDEIEIEICGTWIWVSGNTFKHKETLKSVGFTWRSKKKMWSYGKLNGINNKEWNMNDIRASYGSERVTTNKVHQIA